MNHYHDSGTFFNITVSKFNKIKEHGLLTMKHYHDSGAFFSHKNKHITTGKTVERHVIALTI
jgi:hypothetical protein